MIEVRHLTRRFGALTAVEDLSFSVGPGEVLGLLGPNGAGKTTTLRMLAALIPPSAGEAAVCGHRLGAEDPAVRRAIGLLTESPGLYDRLSARRNLLFHARLHGVADAGAQSEKYLRLLDLWDRRNDPAGALSRGMRQKLALARALLHEPPVLLLDEPTAGLDPRIAHLVRDLIDELRTRGRAIVVSTHNLAEAERLCDRVALLRTRLVALDTPAGLRERLEDRRTVVRLAGADAQVEARSRAAAAALPFVKSAAASEGRLIVRLDDPERDTPPLVRALTGAGIGIVEVTTGARTLEDAYLALMPEEGPLS